MPGRLGTMLVHMERSLPLLLLPFCFVGCRTGYEILSTEDRAIIDGDGGGSNMGGASSGGSGLGASGSGATSSAGGDGNSGGTGGFAGAGNDPVESCVDWWDSDFDLRTRFDFDNGPGEALSDFVVLIVLDSSNFDYSTGGNLGEGLRFVDDDQTTVLEHHVEHYDPSGKSYIWVRVPVIDAGSTTDHVWMYHDGTSTPTQDEAGSYDPSFVGVWHLNEASGTLADSTSNSIDCSWFGSGGNQDGPGVAGGGISTSGTNNGAASAPGQLPPFTSHTISIWARPPTSGGGDQNQSLFSGHETTGDYNGPGIHMSGNQARAGSFVNNSYRYGSSSSDLIRGEWNFVAMRGVAAISEGYIEIKVNGGPWEQVFFGNTMTTVPGAESTVQIGDYDAAAGTWDFLGDLDQLVISSVLRSDSWIRAQYLSEGDLGFVSRAAFETCE